VKLIGEVEGVCRDRRAQVPPGDRRSVVLSTK
jgi:hypothetical protein